jgi:hypothetical protein
MAFYERVLKVVEAKNATSSQRWPEYVSDIDMRNVPGLEFAAVPGSTWVAMTGEEWQKTYKDSSGVADTDFLQRMYKNAMPTIDWDGMGAGASGEQLESESEQSSLDYTLYPTH